MGITAVAAAIVVAAGGSTPLAVAASLVLAARAIGSIPYVRTEIERLRHGPVGTTGTPAPPPACWACAGSCSASSWFAVTAPRCARLTSPTKGLRHADHHTGQPRSATSSAATRRWPGSWSDSGSTTAAVVHGPSPSHAPSTGSMPASVVAVLDAARSERPASPWTTMGLTELVDHIEETHHRFLWHELARLTALIDKVHTVHGARHRELADVAACLVELRADLEPHMMKEERILFPMIRTLATAETSPAFHCGTVQNPISVMLREHDAVGMLLFPAARAHRRIQPRRPTAACRTACCIGVSESSRPTSTSTCTRRTTCCSPWSYGARPSWRRERRGRAHSLCAGRHGDVTVAAVVVGRPRCRLGRSTWHGDLR